MITLAYKLSELAHGWEGIAPARKVIPACIVAKERELDEALAALDLAVDMHEQAYTEATRETLLVATNKVNDISAELDLLREIWLNHPERFEEE